MVCTEIRGDEPFAVLLGDDIICSDEAPGLQQLINEYNEVQSSVIAVKKFLPVRRIVTV